MKKEKEKFHAPGTVVLVFIWFVWFVILYTTNWLALSENWFLR